MELNEYQQISQNFAFYPHALGPYYTTLGTMSMLGKLSERLQKSLKENDGKISQRDKQLIGIAIGDVLYYLACTATDLNLSLDDICRMNIRKNSYQKEQEILNNTNDK